MSKSIKEGKLLYHLVPLDSFESIVQNGLMSRNELQNRGIVFTDTANHEILFGRERLNLSGYIPFHFHIHTAYDTYVKDTHNDKKFIYLRLTRRFAMEHDFKILPFHPTALETPILYSYEEGFNEIDWNVMELTKEEAQIAGIDIRYHRQVRMAECLSPHKLFISDFQSIIVPDRETKDIVTKLLPNVQRKPFIDLDGNRTFF